MKLDSTQSVYVAQLKDLYSTEKQLGAALEKLAEAASNEQLREGFKAHQEQTQEQLKRLEQVFERQGVAAGRKKAKGIAALIEESQEIIDAKGDADAKDAALIAAAQRTEHYEMAIYGTAVALAKQLGHEEDRAALETSLREEKEMDRRLSSLATGEVNPSGEDRDDEAPESQGSEQTSSTRKGSETMARYDYDDDRSSRGGRGYTDSAGRHYSRESWERAQEGRSLGGQHSHGGGRGSSGGGRGGYDDDDDRGYSSSSRGSSGRYSSYDDDDRGGSRGGRGGRGGDITDSAGRHYTRESWERAQEGRSLGGQHSGGGRGGRGGYDDDDRGYSSSSRGYSRSRYDDDNDDRFGSYEGRSRGGRYSSEMQERDEYGQFTGYGGGSSGGRGRSSRDDDDDDRGGYSRGGRGGGGRSSSYDDDDRSDGRSSGGRRSSQMQERDEYGQFTGYSGGGGRGGSRGGGGGGSRGGGSRYDD